MKKKISIEGMSCGHCVNHVKTALLEDMNGVKSADVSLEEKQAIIEVEDSVTDENIKSVIEEVGFEVVNIENI